MTNNEVEAFFKKKSTLTRLKEIYQLTESKYYYGDSQKAKERFERWAKNRLKVGGTSSLLLATKTLMNGEEVGTSL